MGSTISAFSTQLSKWAQPGRFEIVWTTPLSTSRKPLILLDFSDIFRRTVIGVSTEYLRFFDVPIDGLA